MDSMEYTVEQIDGDYAKLILIPQDVDEVGKKYLLDKGYEIRILKDSSIENICRNAGDCNGILARTASYTKEIIEAAPLLKVIARHGVGFDNIDITAATARGIQVCNTPNANAESVAEHTIMLILACAKNLIVSDRELRKGNFDIRNRLPGRDIAGRTLGVIGFGRTGKTVAKKAAIGLDMRVLAYGHHMDEGLPDYVTAVNELEELIRQSDYITLHVPLRKDTMSLINSEKLSLMKPDAVLINTARGGVVNEDDLYQALKEHKIAGAGLDVFDEEPFTGSLPELFKLDNVIVTPHNAALTKDAMARMSLDAAISIDEVLSGRKPSWPVNNL